MYMYATFSTKNIVHNFVVVIVTKHCFQIHTQKRLLQVINSTASTQVNVGRGQTRPMTRN